MFFLIYKARQSVPASAPKSGQPCGGFDARSAIEEIIERIEKIEPCKTRRKKAQKKLETLQISHIFRFAENTGALNASDSSLSDMLAAFSDGERRVNRAWSAIVDSHVLECESCLEAARERFQSVLRAL